MGKTKGVKDLAEFQEALAKIENKQKYPFRLVYRGVYELNKYSKRYLSPSLQFREDGALCKFENEMILEMRRYRPNEFDNLSDLALLGKLQHFKLPTRLLDFSFSPYVALWFALNSKDCDDEGQSKVYCALARPQEDVARVIARAAMNMNSEKYNSNSEYFVEDVLFVGMDEKQKENRLKELLLNIFSKKKKFGHLIFTYPQFNERREQNQQSVFAIYINSIIDISKKNKIDLINATDIESLIEGARLTRRFVFKPQIYNPLGKFLDKTKKLQKNIFEIKIDFSCKAKLIEELRHLGINETFLFPEDLEATSNEVTEYAKKLSESDKKRIDSEAKNK